MFGFKRLNALMSHLNDSLDNKPLTVELIITSCGVTLDPNS
jgi:hypothetical protein